MSMSSRPHVAEQGRAAEPRAVPSQSMSTADRQLSRWGGAAGLAGVGLMVGAVAVVVGFGLPDASDPETLTDFADIESGRIAEHFFYLGALVLFALHVLVLQRLLTRVHPPAALFGAAVAALGYAIMAAGSLLHVSTSPLAELYESSDTPPDDLAAIEYAWHGAQSVFDTMLATGVLLVPIGILLFGLAMRHTQAFGPRLTALTLALGGAGLIGAAVEIVDRGSVASAASVAAIVVFHASVGWRTLKLGNDESIDHPTPIESTPAH